MSYLPLFTERRPKAVGISLVRHAAARLSAQAVATRPAPRELKPGVRGRRSGHSGTAAESRQDCRRRRSLRDQRRESSIPGATLLRDQPLLLTLSAAIGKANAAAESHERRSGASVSVCLDITATERPATALCFCWRPGRSVPTREAGPAPATRTRGSSRIQLKVGHHLGEFHRARRPWELE